MANPMSLMILHRLCSILLCMRCKTYPILAAIGVCLVFSFQSYAETQWSCGALSWVTPPTLENGVFRSTLTAECLMSGGDDQTLSTLAQFIRSDIETSGKLQIHKGPLELSYKGLPAVRYDVTDD